jgi:hypothetical protein
MIGDGERFVSELDGTLHEVFGVRGTIEEGEIGVTVEFGVSGHPSQYIERMFDVFEDATKLP